MNIDIKIHLDLSPRQRRILRAAVVASVVAAAMAVGVASAAPIDVSWIDASKPVSATQLKNDFMTIESRLGAVESKGFVGSIKFQGATCSHGISPLSATFADLPLSGACTASVTPGNVPGAALTAPAAALGTPASFGLTGSAGHYLIIATGNSICLNSNTGAAADRVVCAVQLFDTMTGTASGANASGDIAGGVSTNTRYQWGFGQLNGGFTYANQVNTTIRVQAANLASTTNTAYTLDQSQGIPLEIRVYKL